MSAFGTLENLLIVAERGEESVVFDAGAEEELELLVDDVLGSSTMLVDVVCELMEAMYVLEVESGCPTAAALIARVIERPHVAERLREVSCSQLESSGMQLRAFSDKRERARAPKHAEKAPLGSIKLNRIAPRKRIA